MPKFIPVDEALKVLAAAGHEVAKPGRKQDRVAGFGGPHYLIDGEWHNLSSVRAMVADMGLEKTTKKAEEKPRREIEDLCQAIAKSEFCKRKQLLVSPWGERNLRGQVVHALSWYTKDGERKRCFKTVSWIREYCKRNGIITG